MGAASKSKGGRKVQRLPGHAKSQTKQAFRSGTSSTNESRSLPENKKSGFYRTKSTIKRLNMYTSKVDFKKRKEQPKEPARMPPDRKWFENTRLINQTQLETFRKEMALVKNDPYNIVLKRSKLPLPLLTEKTTPTKARLLNLEPFGSTFGAKGVRKRPKLAHVSLEGLTQTAQSKASEYNSSTDSSALKTEHSETAVSEQIFEKGTSKRIWRELYKVIDSSDILVQVIDARDPLATRCPRLESHIGKDRTHKHVILLLNKCDLIPAWAAERWVKVLSAEYPTIAFHASVTNPFGKNALMQLLRQFAKLLKDKKHVGIGFFGYPNVGKSSVINTLKRNKVCKVAPTPGETRVWQYIALTSKMYLIDCPGVVPADESEDSETAKVLKGVVRAERIKAPETHIYQILNRVKKEYLLSRYKLQDPNWSDPDEFLQKVALAMGKLLKGGEPDIMTAARILIYDWQRGRLPYFVTPPFGRPGQAPKAQMEAHTIESGVASQDLDGDRELAPECITQKEDRSSVSQSLKKLECKLMFDKNDRVPPKESDST